MSKELGEVLNFNPDLCLSTLRDAGLKSLGKFDLRKKSQVFLFECKAVLKTSMSLSEQKVLYAIFL